ncbi:YbjN domain-containing protein [Synechococcus sp. CBW1002]|uniref:YbjN domain-containing protein n=1 Tax=Synechococcus sp. CBW1002 TaxID=1353134 RepID=UPI0018CF7221|nr:YbjN domain-containing protein [Synechococcus sp. CBW1002]QPN58775.1 YbjN domain-containing protein [Synechococcus sp. CBW1002]
MATLPRFLAELVARLSLPPQPVSPVEDAVDLVDEVLESLGVSGQRQDGEEGFDWSFQVGSAPIEVAIHPNPVLGELTLEVRSPMLKLPCGNLLALYRRCLELNRIVVGCSIGVDQDVLVVAEERRLPGLDPPVFLQMLLNVASAADQFDDELAMEFGAIKLGQESADPDPE